MKLMNTQDYIKSLKELMTELGKEVSDYSISFRSDTRREEEQGSLTFTFVIKSRKNNKAKEYKIALYIFENKKTVTSFIINGRTLNLLFENSTMDSPKVALHYLKDILLSEVKWVRELEDLLAKQKADAMRKKMNNRRQPGKSRNDSYNNHKNNGYKKNNNYRHNNHNDDRGESKPYNRNQGSRRVSSSINIRTTKYPYGKPKTGGQ